MGFSGKRFFYQGTVSFEVLDRLVNESFMRGLAMKFSLGAAGKTNCVVRFADAVHGILAETTRLSRNPTLRAHEENAQWAA